MDAISEADSLEKAYEEIENQLGISGPRLFYNPSELVYKKLIIKDGMARIDFSYGDKYLYYQQMSKGVANSIGYNSDRELYKSIHNRFLNNEINVYRNELETGNIEFNAQYINENTVFYLVGNIDEKVFDKIVKNLSYVEHQSFCINTKDSIFLVCNHTHRRCQRLTSCDSLFFPHRHFYVLWK